MKLILKKRWTNVFGRVYPIGQILQCDKDLSSQLISDGYADEYTGPYPPNGKVKTDLFNPKKK